MYLWTGFELIYQDETTQTNVIYNTPENMFMVYDDSIKEEPLFAVRYGVDDEGKIQGEVYTLLETIEINGEASDLSFEKEVIILIQNCPLLSFILTKRE